MVSSPLIAIATDSFKGSMSSKCAAEAMAVGARRVFPGAQFLEILIADGGEGTVEAVLTSLGGDWVSHTVTGPMGEPVDAAYGFVPEKKIAIIEMATASGLTLVPLADRNPMQATTYGTGELILDALRRGAADIIIGIGGSATIDGGVGVAQAPGVVFYDEGGTVIDAPITSADISRIATIDASKAEKLLAGVKVTAACDVDNTLAGEEGAANVFGRQKGATEEDVAYLDASLAAYGALLKAITGKTIIGAPYTGAGGGITASLYGLLGADLVPGIELISNVIDLSGQLEGASLVLTGEGSIDSQTVFGKTPVGVAKVAKQHGLPVIAIAGQLSDDAAVVFGHGIDALESAYARSVPIDVAIADAATYIANAAERALRLVKLGQALR